MGHLSSEKCSELSGMAQSLIEIILEESVDGINT
jgi:hypothetical protein